MSVLVITVIYQIPHATHQFALKIMKLNIWHIQLPILHIDLGVAQTFSDAAWMNIVIWHIDFTFAYGISLQMAGTPCNTDEFNMEIFIALCIISWVQKSMVFS